MELIPTAFHFIDEEAEAQRGEVICPTSQLENGRTLTKGQALVPWAASSSSRHLGVAEGETG